MIQKLTMHRLWCICWLMLWRNLVGGIVIGTVVGVMWAIITGSRAGMDSVTYLTLFVWSIFVLRMALRKKYHDFRIVLVRVEQK
jgi:hypothetical protein